MRSRLQKDPLLEELRRISRMSGVTTSIVEAPSEIRAKLHQHAPQELVKNLKDSMQGAPSRPDLPPVTGSLPSQHGSSCSSRTPRPASSVPPNLSAPSMDFVHPNAALQRPMTEQSPRGGGDGRPPRRAAVEAEAPTADALNQASMYQPPPMHLQAEEADRLMRRTAPLPVAQQQPQQQQQQQTAAFITDYTVSERQAPPSPTYNTSAGIVATPLLQPKQHPSAVKYLSDFDARGISTPTPPAHSAILSRVVASGERLESELARAMASASEDAAKGVEAARMEMLKLHLASLQEMQSQCAHMQGLAEAKSLALAKQVEELKRENSKKRHESARLRWAITKGNVNDLQETAAWAFMAGGSG